MDTVRNMGIFIFLHNSSGKKDNKRDCSVNDSRLKGFGDRVYNRWGALSTAKVGRSFLQFMVYN